MHRSSPHFQFVQYEYRYSLQSIFGRRNGILLRSEIIIDQLYGYSCTGTQYEYSSATVPILCVATVSLQLQLYSCTWDHSVPMYSTDYSTTVVHVRYEYSCTVPRYMYGIPVPITKVPVPYHRITVHGNDIAPTPTPSTT